MHGADKKNQNIWRRNMDEISSLRMTERWMDLTKRAVQCVITRPPKWGDEIQMVVATARDFSAQHFP